MATSAKGSGYQMRMAVIGIIVAGTLKPPIVCIQGRACLVDQTSVAFEVCSKAATALSARRKGWGRVLPRFSARRRIPAQAVGLK